MDYYPGTYIIGFGIGFGAVGMYAGAC